MYDVAFGATRVQAAIDKCLPGRTIATLEGPVATERTAASTLIADALEAPIGCARLREVARGAASACVLVPGVDRIAAVHDFAPFLLAELREAGIRDDRVRIFLATGTHEHKGFEDLEMLLGRDCVRSVDCRIHDPDDRANVIEMGVTSRGTPVEFHRAVLEAEVKILTGRVVPHYFAGFGGGRKALLPGCASRRAIFANHRLTLAPERGVAPGVAPCSLTTNPVHLDMLEAARLARPTFSLSLLLDSNHRVVDVFAGDPESAHTSACARALEVHQVRVPGPVDAVISSAGGSPYDCNFVQSLKALFNVQEILRPGGAILCVAECGRDGTKNFLKWAAIEDDAELEARVRARYDLAGHNSVMLRALRRRVEIGLVSALARETVRNLGLHPFDSVEAGLRWLNERLPPNAQVAFVPHANITHVALERSASA